MCSAQALAIILFGRFQNLLINSRKPLTSSNFKFWSRLRLAITYIYWTFVLSNTYCKMEYEFSQTLKLFFLAAGGANSVDQAPGSGPSAPAVRQVVRQQPRGGGGGGSPRVTATPKTIRQTTPTVTARSQQQQNINSRIGEILSATSASEPPAGKDSLAKTEIIYP